MLRASGYLLIAISILHVGVGIWSYAEPITGIWQDGFFNVVDPYVDRQAAFWFMMAAPLFFAVGQLCCWAQAQNITLPASLGWNLLAVSTVGAVLMPISGFWLLMLPAFLILVASRQASTRSAATTEKSDAS